jgi:CubicO group peptidase (beta-lactamase class C family)
MESNRTEQNKETPVGIGVEMKIHSLAKIAIGLGAVGGVYLLIQKRRNASSIATASPASIHGFVNSGFEAVREAFVENFVRRREIGAACCVYHNGEKVIDLWGGVRNKTTGEPWEEDTMALVYSATKGMAAMTLALAHSRGWLHYDELVCTYWPEFAQNGKENITVRQLLAHQAGLFALDEPVAREIVADPDRLAQILARQKPAWEPGTRQGYHAVTIGYYESELLRRIDPQHRTLGQFFQDEIATPLSLDFFIRLPESIPDSRLSPLIDPSLSEMLFAFPLNLTLDVWSPHSKIRRALLGSELPHDKQHTYVRNLEVPAGGGVGTARAIAHAYSVFATGGRELGLRTETLEQLKAPAVPPTHGFYDEVMKGEVQFSLGFMKSNSAFPFGSPSSFGAPGAGGSLGFADPETKIGYAYVPNRKSVCLHGDPRDMAIREALYSALPVASHLEIESRKPQGKSFAAKMDLRGHA